MIRRDFLYIIGIFLVWRIYLIVLLIFAVNFIPLGSKDRFLGGGPTNYQLSPYLFSWANFDGEHYLSVAIFGYKGLEQAFFPTFPLLISSFSKPISTDLFSSLLNSTLIGLTISNLALLLSLILLFDLIRIDFSKKIAYLTIITLLMFPTSFYLGALYTESLFLLLTILTFISIKKNNFFLAGIIGGISSATRIFGIILLPAILVEAWQRKISWKKVIWLFMIPAGLLFYMYYQYLTIGDPLAFYHLQKIVGEQHQSGLTLLPQVFFRYIKMLLTTPSSNPIFPTIFLEFIVGIMFFALPIYGFFKKMPLSYLIFALVGFLIPTVQGSFSSVPRYVLVFFPSFIALVILLSNLPKAFKLLYLILSFLGLTLFSIMFLRGYWVA